LIAFQYVAALLVGRLRSGLVGRPRHVVRTRHGVRTRRDEAAQFLEALSPIPRAGTLSTRS